MITAAQKSRADLCIIPLQDYLVLGNEGRINTPSTIKGNWQWRMPLSVMEDKNLIRKIRELSEASGRI